MESVEHDICTVDLSKADVVMMYLLPWMTNKLLPQFHGMKDGCRIVSHDFWIDGVEPDGFVELNDAGWDRPDLIYLDRTPLRLNPAMEKGMPPRPGEGQASQSPG